MPPKKVGTSLAAAPALVKKTATPAATTSKKLVSVPVPVKETKKTMVESEEESEEESDDGSANDSDSDSSDSDDETILDTTLVQLPPPKAIVPTTTVPKQQQQQQQQKKTEKIEENSTTTSTTITTPTTVPIRTLKRTEVWLDIQVPPYDLGRVVIELYPDCPLSHENFRSLCTGEITDPNTKQKLTYAGTMIDQINDDYIVLGEIADDADERDGIEIISDDIDADNDDSDDDGIGGVKTIIKTKKNSGNSVQKAQVLSKNQKINIIHDTKKQAVSIYGGFFPDEPAGLARQHLKAGTVSMFAEKTNRNGSKFMITLKPHMSWLDGQYTVIGQVTSGLKTLHSLISYKDTEETAVISNCGRMKKNSQGVDKVNDFLTQAIEITQGKTQGLTNTSTNTTNTTDKKTNDNDTSSDKNRQVFCDKCPAMAKYKSRQLGKGCRYICRDPVCGNSFWVADDKYSEEVIQKAIELKKETKQQVHVQTVLMQSADYRKKLHQAEKEARLEKKKIKEETLKLLEKKGPKAKKAAEKVAQEKAEAEKAEKAEKAAKKIAEVEASSKVPKTTIIYASPDLAVCAQNAMASVVDHKNAKARALVQGRKDHEKFVKEKKLERGELDENGDFIEKPYIKRTYQDFEETNGKADDVLNQWFGGKVKKSKGNDEKVQNRQFRKIYNDKTNPENKSMLEELASMPKDSRRQFKRQIGITPGPSKTMQTNMNKKRVDTKTIPKKATFKSVQRMQFDVKTQQDAKKKKDKVRWRDRDAKSLPQGYVTREARRDQLRGD